MKSLCVLCVVICISYSSARSLDPAAPYDPNNIYAPELDTEEPEELPEGPILDSCDDFPPASCMDIFTSLPASLRRNPFSLRTERDFTLICNAYKEAIPCFGNFAKRCKPDQPEAWAFTDQMSTLLNQCDNPVIRQDAIVALECGRRMGAVHDRCIRETRFIPQLKNLSAQRMLQGEPNSVRDLCCGLKYHKTCFMDQVQERCGQASHEAHQRLERILIRGFNCDSYSDSDCPAVRP